MVRDLQRLTASRDRKHFKDAIFWFCPFAWVRKNMGEWGRTPELSEERWLCFDVRYNGWGPDLCYREWTNHGLWQVTAFPQAVAWLKEWIYNSVLQFSISKSVYWLMRQDLEKRLSKLVTHRKTVHRKVYLGDVPDERVDTMLRPEPVWEYQKRALLRQGKLGPEALVSRTQWYDQVEELDQTHADRRLELANELVQLPLFTAYCRTATTQHHVALNPPVKADIDEARIERIRQMSKTRFGRPPEEPPAPPVAPEELPEEPTGPGITRGYRREG